MNNEQQDREEEIFLRALELAPGEARAAWLEEACGGDSDLRLSVEELLEAHDEPASLLGDTEADVERVATLPAETYNVQGGTVAATTAGAGAFTDTAAANANNADARQSGHHAEGLPWLWLSTGGFVLLALSGILWRLMAGTGSRRRGSTSATSPAPGQTAPRRSVPGHEVKIARALKTLASACDRNDRVDAYTACFKWLYLAYGASSLRPLRLEEISPQLARELASMERALYAEDNQAPWSGKSLSIAIASAAASLTAANVRRSRTEILPPLYPARTSH